MSTLGDLVVITAEDVGFHKSPYFESNCACPDPGGTMRQAPTTLRDGQLYEKAQAHLDYIAPGFLVGFAPLRASGAVVLNEPARNLVDLFTHPSTPDAALLRAGDPANGRLIVSRLVHTGMLKAAGETAEPQSVPAQTLTAWIHVTNECNLRCTYCYVDKSTAEMDLTQGRQSVDAVFRSALANGFRRVKLKYAGGEATLNFALVNSLHHYARDLAQRHAIELDEVVLSNGVALSRRMIDDMLAGGIRLMISLDGIGDYHDVQRPFVNGHGSFAHVERTLDRLAGHGLVPSISITVSNQNLPGLAATVRYVLERKLPFTLNFYRENDCSASFANLTYRDEQVIAAMKEAFSVIEADLPRYSLLGALVDLARLDTSHERTCGVGQSYMVINHRGGVAKCHMELEKTVTDIHAGDPLRLIRGDQIGLQNPRVEEKEGCRDCTWRYWCAGGCPALTYRVMGRYDVKSPNCRVYKALFPEVLRLEGLRLLKYGYM